MSSLTLAGGERELAALSAAIEAGRVVLVSGDAGIGKTRLVQEATATPCRRRVPSHDADSLRMPEPSPKDGKRRRRPVKVPVPR